MDYTTSPVCRLISDIGCLFFGNTYHTCKMCLPYIASDFFLQVHQQCWTFILWSWFPYPHRAIVRSQKTKTKQNKECEGGFETYKCKGWLLLSNLQVFCFYATHLCFLWKVLRMGVWKENVFWPSWPEIGFHGSCSGLFTLAECYIWPRQTIAAKQRNSFSMNCDGSE